MASFMVKPGGADTAAVKLEAKPPPGPPPRRASRPEPASAGTADAPTEGGAPPDAVADGTPREAATSALDQMLDEDQGNKPPVFQELRTLSAAGDGSGEAGIFEFQASEIAEIDSDEEDGGASSRATTAASDASDGGTGERGGKRGKGGKGGKGGKWKAARAKLKTADALKKARRGESGDGQQHGDLTVVDIEDGERGTAAGAEAGAGAVAVHRVGDDDLDVEVELQLEDISSDEDEEVGAAHDAASLANSLSSELDHDDEEVLRGSRRKALVVPPPPSLPPPLTHTRTHSHHTRHHPRHA